MIQWLERHKNIVTKRPHKNAMKKLKLSPKNPNTPEEAPLRSPQEILAEMAELDRETNAILESLKELI